VSPVKALVLSWLSVKFDLASRDLRRSVSDCSLLILDASSLYAINFGCGKH